MGSAEKNFAAKEAIVAHLQSQVDQLQRALCVRTTELDQADRHIARLEESLLRLKQAKRELRELRRERRALRSSPERRIGQVLLAPYRLPQRLFREIRKRFGLPRWPSPEPAKTEYQAWLDRHRVSLAQARGMREESRIFSYRPLISIITPVFNTPGAWLKEAIDSVLAQAYENWELILVDDASTNRKTLEVLHWQSSRDARIRLIRLEQNGGISVASNRGLAEAQGEWIGLLDHDDLLEPDALFQTAKLLQTHSDVDLIYSDEDKFTEEGFADPMLKPDWSPDFFLACNYLCHFITIRRELVLRIGGFCSQFDGSQDYDLLLRAIERTDRIHHIPRVLYHWRLSENCSASDVRQKPGQLEGSWRAIEAHLKRRGEAAHVAVDWRTHAFYVRRELREAKKICVIISSFHGPESLDRCVESVVSKTSYPNYEIVIAKMGERDKVHEAGTDFRVLRL